MCRQCPWLFGSQVLRRKLLSRPQYQKLLQSICNIFLPSILLSLWTARHLTVTHIDPLRKWFASWIFISRRPWHLLMGNHGKGFAILLWIAQDIKERHAPKENLWLNPQLPFNEILKILDFIYRDSCLIVQKLILLPRPLGSVITRALRH